MKDLVSEATKNQKPLTTSDVEVGIRTAISATFSAQTTMAKMDQIAYVCLCVNLYRMYSSWIMRVADSSNTVGNYLEVLKKEFAEVWQNILYSEQTVKNMLTLGSLCLLHGPMMIMGHLYLHYKSKLLPTTKNQAYLYASTLTNPAMQRYYVAHLQEASTRTNLMLLKDSEDVAFPEGPPLAPEINRSQPCVFLWTQEVFLTRAYALYRAAMLKPIVQSSMDAVKNEELLLAGQKRLLLNNPEALFHGQLAKVRHIVFPLHFTTCLCHIRGFFTSCV
jgi:hypothetical protein